MFIKLVSYGKCPKILNTSILLYLKFAFCVVVLKNYCGMANCVDPDQTAPSGAV